MPNKPLTHDECLGRVCAVCTNLRGLKLTRKVSEEEEKAIQEFNPLFKRGSRYFPQGLCNTCHVFLKRGRGEEEEGKSSLHNIEPILPENYHCFLPHETRNAPQVPCTCRWCKIGRLNGNKLKSWLSAAKKSREDQPAIHTICSKCGRGLMLGQKTQVQQLRFEHSEHHAAADPLLHQTQTHQLFTKRAGGW